MGFLSNIVNSVKKVIKPVAHIGAAVLSGGQTIPISAAMLSKSVAPMETPVFSEVQTGNTSDWFGGALDAYLKDRTNKQNVELSKYNLEASERARVQGMDFTLRREALQSQTSGTYNPLPGGFSNFPFADNAANKMAQTASGMPNWLMPVVLGIAAMALIPIMMRR